MNTALSTLILKDTYTPSACLKRLRLLESFIEADLFQKKETSQGLSPDDESWINSIGKKLLTSLTKETYQASFQEAEAQIKQISPLTIFVPLGLPDKELRELGIYARRLFGDKFLIETKTDPSLITGAALAWKGLYRDYSLRKKMDNQQQLVLGTLKQYIKH